MADTLTEFGLIARHFRPLATHVGALALSDDACVLQEEAARDTIQKPEPGPNRATRVSNKASN